MLDRDPHADQPPDPSALRHRSRSHKPKSASKKQPQRGLGVAQLEKLRLEEQNKQHEAACLASLQQQDHTRYIHFQQQEQVPYLHFHRQSFLPHQGQTPSSCASRQIKHMELPYVQPALAEVRTSPSSAKLNLLHISFSPPATTANRYQNPPLPLHLLQQQLLTEDEASTSLTSQMHDLCSAVAPHIRPSSAESRLSPILTHTSTASLVEKSWLNHLYDREPSTEKERPLNDLSTARCHDNYTKMRDEYQNFAADGVNAAIAKLNGEKGRRPLSMENLYMRNHACVVPFTESILRCDRVFDAANTLQVTHLNSTPLASTGGENQMKELSSFQTISLCPPSSHVDKVFNRKRSWGCTQEVSRPVTSLKGVDLNTSADEMESELTEQGPKVTIPFTVRDDWNPFLVQSVEELNDAKRKGLVSVTSRSWSDSPNVDERPLMDAYAHEITFMNLQKGIANSEKWPVETPGKFLTLGPSPTVIQKTRNAPSGSGSGGTYPAQKTLEKEGNTWQSQDIVLEQARMSCQSSLSRKANTDVISLEYQKSFADCAGQRDIGISEFFLFKNVGTLLRESSTDESLDLELRLSI